MNTVVAAVLIFCTRLILYTHTRRIEDFDKCVSETSTGYMYESEKAFDIIWNSPSQVCRKNYGVNLNISSYGIEENKDEAFSGENMVIFYENQLGLYPKIWSDGSLFQGGVPQKVDFSAHFDKVRKDVTRVIPDPSFSGVAVVDWESWVPLWENNYDKKEVYRTVSRDFVKQQHPEWNETLVEQEAKLEFESGARKLMEGTLLLARCLRPKGKWGYYLYPSCGNYHRWHRNCTNQTITLNNRMSWLFNASTALFPSVYLPTETSTSDLTNFEFHMIAEAFRIRTYIMQPYLPIFVYTRYRHSDTNKFYSHDDLVLSLGVAASTGSNGAVLWGDSANVATEDLCIQLKTYIEIFLGPIAQSFINQTNVCSQNLCNRHGRCYWTFGNDLLKLIQGKAGLDTVNKYFNISEYELVSIAMKILTTQFTHTSNMNTAEWNDMKHKEFESDYQCSCYPGWTGKNCSVPLFT